MWKFERIGIDPAYETGQNAMKYCSPREELRWLTNSTNSATEDVKVGGNGIVSSSSKCKLIPLTTHSDAAIGNVLWCKSNAFLSPSIGNVERLKMYRRVTQSPWSTRASGNKASFNDTQVSFGSIIVRSNLLLSAARKCIPNVQTPGLYDTHLITCSERNEDRDGAGAVTAEWACIEACDGRERRCGVYITG